MVCAGQAIMQGKLVFSQSLSTFFSMKRLCMNGLPLFVEEGGSCKIHASARRSTLSE
ncbi:hypothetical protein SBA5_20028 [Candidatus Sulfotelmatomonas gaucii]|uniref:Uncharacterized protein n=1 Tax=Candidatus Sulfuritelmatomonas gaucii TaxID=2043161 RepID=A0A2N9L771_9BACT|nr:hypothetical protein SBA5_20028 [Candidatus Sulfotelmatomonas gaucii]